MLLIVYIENQGKIWSKSRKNWKKRSFIDLQRL